MDVNDVNKMWEKIELNSCYPLIPNQDFGLYDPETQEKIQKNGSEIIKSLNEES